jgi:type II secretory ATPase GspE/PulE/Tfp pilus assembly ATPase PilB-like protein
VKSLIADAIRRSASDIHIEPEAGSVRVRYRMDGRLHPILTLETSRLQSIVARTKIISGLDISECRQDGAAQVRVENRVCELRVSTLPGIHGEAVVIRVLCQDPALAELEELGLEPAMLAELRQVLAAKEGMLLVTGPTGSGNTTTLYAALGHLNTDDVNIITVEDPVEIKLPSINQVQVSERRW